MKETKFMSEVEYLRFKEKLRNIIISIVIGFVIGVLIGKWSSPESSGWVVTGIMFAGVPYAWSLIPVTFFGWAGLLIKLMISVILGWAITPIALIYNFLQMKRYEKHVKVASAVEEEEKKAS